MGSSKPGGLHYGGLVKLRETKSDMELLQELCKPDIGFEKLLNTKRGDMDANVIEGLLDVLVDVTSCDNLGSTEYIIQVMTDVRNSTFLQTHLSQYYMNIMVDKHPLQYLKPINNSIKLFKKLIQLQPSSAREIIIAQTTLERVVITTHKTTLFKFPAKTIQEVSELQAECERVIIKGKKQEIYSHKVSYDMAEDDVSPPDNFRYISIFPTMGELKSKEMLSLRPNIEVGHYNDLDHYLDVHFRLLKEDFLHPLRDGISTYQDMVATGDLNQKLNDIKVYHNVKVLKSVCAFNGINHLISFDVSKLKDVKWINTKGLIYGSLLCLSKDNFENVHFATVSNSSHEMLNKGILEIEFAHQFADTDFSNYTYVMAESTAFFEAYRHVLKDLQEVNAHLPFQKYLIDCIREIDPPKYVLEKQNITFNIPFPYERQIKLMDDQSWPTYQELKLDLPQYLALKAALSNEMTIIQGPPGTGKTFIGLKIMQCLLSNKCVWQFPVRSPILVVCLTNHALDQFLEGILMHMSEPQNLIRVGGRSKSDLLESMKLAEYREWMRICSSTPISYYHDRRKASDNKQNYKDKIENSQRKLKRSEDKFMDEHVLERYMSNGHLEALQSKYSQYICDVSSKGIRNNKCTVLLTWLGFGDLHKASTLVSDKYFNESNDDEEDDELSDDEATIAKNNRTLDMYDKTDDYERKTQRKCVLDISNKVDTQFPEQQNQWQFQKNELERRERAFKKCIINEAAMTNREVETLGNICDLVMTDRWKLYKYWVRRYQEAMRNTIIQFKYSYQHACDQYKLALENENIYVMGTADIIGMTTTGAARHSKVLAQVRPKIVIVEEAAEVLEAHIITSLSPACEHLILIGDHKQLQPNPMVYELAERFKLKVSLFERMINNGIPCVSLETQYRMRPEISMFMKHIYPELKDSESVKGMENVKGVSRNVFLINHSYLEDHDEESTSKSNLHEVTFLIALCWYLLQQGYKPDQITILTGYAGQVLLLKNNLPTEQFEGVRITSIDDFQGEENDIIIMSLVRSNEKKLVGFLKVDNRICVSMSRARQGLYVIGNFDMLRKRCELWEKIVKTAEDNTVFGSTLPLYCQNHPEDGGLEVKHHTDFARAPEGGCMKPCLTRLSCGHQCTLRCHPYDPKHLEFICKKPCPLITCDKHHTKCQRMCYEECDVCEEQVEKHIPECEHVQMVPCYLDPCLFECKQLVYKPLPCKHETKKIECYIDPTISMCTNKCEAILDCGHACSGTCGECLQGKVHKACCRPYIDNMNCGHICERFCMETKYGFQASNNFPLNKHISLEVGMCQEKCLWRCKHLKCTKKCNDPCSRGRCDFRCEKKLSCGHQCAGICGERCLSLCVVCNPEQMQKIHPLYDHQNTRFIELVACKHIFEVTTLDKYMDDAGNGFIRNIKMKACPKCQTPIKGDLRYGNVTKPIIKDIAAILHEHNNQIVFHTGMLQNRLLKMRDEVGHATSGNKATSGNEVDDENNNTLSFFDDILNLNHGIANLLQRMKEQSYSNQVLDEIYWECMRLQILFEFIQIATMREKLPENKFPGICEILYKCAVELKLVTKLTPEVMKIDGKVFNSLKLTIGYEVPKEVLIMKYPLPKDPSCCYRCNQVSLSWLKLIN